MNQHYILSIDPQATHEWDRCVLRNPITGERPDLQKAIANSVNNRAGSYLIKVNINVEILEQTTPNQPSTPITMPITSQRHLSVSK